MNIFLYQALIASTVFLSAVLWSPQAMLFAALFWVIWTFANVYPAWLIIMQLAVVALSCWAGASIFDQSKVIARRKMLAIAVAAIGFPLLIFAVVESGNNSEYNNWDISSEKKMVDPSGSSNYPRRLESSGVVDGELDRVISKIERQYPILNPNSSSYSQDHVDRVLRRKEVYISDGLRPADALEAAAQDVIYYSNNANRSMENKSINSRSESNKKIYLCPGNAYQDFPCDERK